MNIVRKINYSIFFSFKFDWHDRLNNIFAKISKQMAIFDRTNLHFMSLRRKDFDRNNRLKGGKGRKTTLAIKGGRFVGESVSEIGWKRKRSCASSIYDFSRMQISIDYNLVTLRDISFIIMLFNYIFFYSYC